MRTVRSVPAEHGKPRDGTLTQRQRAMADWIAAFERKRGRAPTQREIGAAHGMSQGSVWSYLKAISTQEREGHRRSDAGREEEAARLLANWLRFLERVGPLASRLGARSLRAETKAWITSFGVPQNGQEGSGQ